MSRRKQTTKFDLDDRVRIIGPRVCNFDPDMPYYDVEPGTVGAVWDVQEEYGEYTVAVDSGHGYDQWVFPESSLAAEGGAAR